MRRRSVSVAVVAFLGIFVGCSTSATVPVAVLAAHATRTTATPVVSTVGSTAVPATTTVPSPVTPPLAPAPPTAAIASSDRIAQAESLVGYDWRALLPGWTVSFEGPHGAQRGGTYVATHAIKVFVSPSEPVALIAHTFAHELGHAVDITYMWYSPGDSDHQRFNAARGRVADTPWVKPSVVGSEADFGEPVGDFAECFAWTVTNGAGGFYSQMGSPPDAATRALIAQIDHA